MSNAPVLLEHLRELRERRPRSLERLYGKRGPTPEQRAAYDDAVKAWGREYRAAQRAWKAAAADELR